MTGATVLVVEDNDRNLRLVRDVLEHAVPVLRRLRLPATFFVPGFDAETNPGTIRSGSGMSGASR